MSSFSVNHSQEMLHIVLNCDKKLKHEIVDYLAFWRLSKSRKITGPLFSNAMKTKFGGKWIVLVCEDEEDKEEICGLSTAQLPKLERLSAWYGQTYWDVMRFQ